MEEVCVPLPEDAELQPVGTVSSIIQQLGKYIQSHIEVTLQLEFWRTRVENNVSGGSRCLFCQLCFSVSAVIIQSLKDTPVLTDESILFRSDRLALAKVGWPAEAFCTTTKQKKRIVWCYVDVRFPRGNVLLFMCFRCLRCLVQCPVRCIFCVLTLRTR